MTELTDGNFQSFKNFEDHLLETNFLTQTNETCDPIFPLLNISSIGFKISIFIKIFPVTGRLPDHKLRTLELLVLYRLDVSF